MTPTTIQEARFTADLLKQSPWQYSDTACSAIHSLADQLEAATADCEKFANQTFAVKAEATTLVNYANKQVARLTAERDNAVESALQAALVQPAPERKLYEASRDAAIDTLLGMGYTYFGAAQWKPPIAQPVQPTPSSRSEKSDKLLSSLIGIILNNRQHIGYVNGSPVDQEVKAAVDHLKDWNLLAQPPSQPATTREAFEESETDWVETDCPTIRVDLLARTMKGDYAQALMRLKWKVWQAATAQEREACAKLCEAMQPIYTEGWTNEQEAINEVFSFLVHDIRARSNDE